MLLWKRYLRYRYKKALDRAAKHHDTENERQRCLALVNEVTTAQFSLYEVTTGVATKINVPDRDIDTYIERLRRIHRTLTANRALQAHDFSWDIQTVSVDEFFISAKGFYQDAEKAVERFKVAALQVCEEAKKVDGAETGIEGLNRRLLTKLFINMQDLSKALIDVSLTN